ncbi:MAG: TMEM165/GDT1 family protein [Bdellovibrionales bacterium]|nr:TMEM165/GDT1 family protein [Bdellovibrionales bacterium]
MSVVLNSFILVFLSEMGDKTQLLALVLVSKFRKPVPILFGIFLATVLNHALASYFGKLISNYISHDVLKWFLAGTFIFFGIWLLKSDQEDGSENPFSWGPFWTTVVTFFFAEMGDKTQLATAAIAAKYVDPLLVTIGTTLGMMGADGLAVVFGNNFLKKVSIKLVNKLACILFILFGLGIFFGY